MLNRYRAALASLALSGSLLASASGASASSAMVSNMPASGAVFACQSGTYIVTAGSLRFVMQDATSASGNTEITGTVVPEGVVLTDGHGKTYSLAGSSWFGGTFNAQTGASQMTDTADFQILSKTGGFVASVQEVFHVDGTGTVVLDKGSCVSPN
jgi:hypothetical protein